MFFEYIFFAINYSILRGQDGFIILFLTDAIKKGKWLSIYELVFCLFWSLFYQTCIHLFDINFYS
jgi:hypothetical protein